MVDHHDAEEPFLAGLIKHVCQIRPLILANRSGGEKRQGRHAGIHADQSEGAPSAHVGKTRDLLSVRRIRAHVGRKNLEHVRQGAADIGIMVARYDRDSFRRAQTCDAGMGIGEFRRETDIDEIPRQRDVIRLVGDDIVENRFEHIHVMDGGAGTMPIERTGEPLVQKRAQGQLRQGADMGVGKMGEGEDQAKGPARNAASVSPLGAAASSGSFPVPVTLRPHERVMRWVFHRWFRLTRGMTMGVRAAVFDKEGRVYLVRHTYMPGWHLPGGGIEGGQCAREALDMELAEEGHIRLLSEPDLFGIYQNRIAAPRDHVLLYVVRDFEQAGPRAPDRELAETGFFALDALPEHTTAATRRRLREILEGLAPARFW